MEFGVKGKGVLYEESDLNSSLAFLSLSSMIIIHWSAMISTIKYKFGTCQLVRIMLYTDIYILPLYINELHDMPLLPTEHKGAVIGRLLYFYFTVKIFGSLWHLFLSLFSLQTDGFDRTIGLKKHSTLNVKSSPVQVALLVGVSMPKSFGFHHWSGHIR